MCVTVINIMALVLAINIVLMLTSIATASVRCSACTVFDLKGGLDPTLQLWGFQALGDWHSIAICTLIARAWSLTS